MLEWGCIHRETWDLGPYAGTDYKTSPDLIVDPEVSFPPQLQR